MKQFRAQPTLLHQRLVRPLIYQLPPFSTRIRSAIRTVENAIEIAARHGVATLRNIFTGRCPEPHAWKGLTTRAEHGVPSSDFSRVVRSSGIAARPFAALEGRSR